MIAYAITVGGSSSGRSCLNRLKSSHRAAAIDVPIQPWPATVPEQVDDIMAQEGLVWTYPWSGITVDRDSGLELHPYTTRVRQARVACFLSHYRLWTLALDTDQWITVLEDDAEFVRRFEPETLPYRSWGAVGLCDPRGATRRARVFHERVSEQRDQALIIEAPTIDRPVVPQGLAGHSAYMIGPDLASRLIDKSKVNGCWPNDALMCKQLFPDIGVTTTYYTRVQGRPSNLA